MFHSKPKVKPKKKKIESSKRELKHMNKREQLVYSCCKQTLETNKNVTVKE